MFAYPAVVTRATMQPWRLTKEKLQDASRGDVERLARWLGFVQPGAWQGRVLLRRVWRVTRSDRKRAVRERHLAGAREEDLLRLARFLGLHPRASWSRAKLESRVWRNVDAQRTAR